MSEIKTSVLKDITSSIETALAKAGVMYRLFFRGKSIKSIEHKIALKGNGYYSADGKKIQDGLGLRIIFYFREDVELFADYLHTNSEDECIDISDSESDFKKKYTAPDDVKYEEVFAPQRLNMVFRMNQERAMIFKDDLLGVNFSDPAHIDIIDSTYEIQLRTVLSEGWHEVEHDIRYKCRNDAMWTYCKEESRALNGIFAGLETNERAMEMLLHNMAYKNYRNQDWEAMLRNHFLLKVDPYSKLDVRLKSILSDSSNRVAKKIFSFGRRELQNELLNIRKDYPITYNNIIYLVNRLLDTEMNQDILGLEPSIITERLDEHFSNVLALKEVDS